MRRRRERRIEALTDGALPRSLEPEIRSLLDRDGEARRVLRRTEGIGRLLRDAFDGAPPPPDPETLLARLRPSLMRIDRELSALPSWRRALDRARDGLRPALAVGVGAAAVVALTLLWPVLPTPSGPGIAHADATVRSLRQQGTAVVVFEGGEGATIIWLLDPEDPDLSSGPAEAIWS